MSARFIRRGVSKFYFVPVIADKFVPTRIEIDAGTDLTPDIADVSGWMLENSSAATPDMASTFESSIPGLDSAADSSLTLYEDELEEIIETLLPKGTPGNVLIMRKGDKPLSKSMDVFPIRVGSKGSEYSAGNDPARLVVTFAITEEPALDVAVPAAAI